jgi:hypothetical protein
LNQPTGNALEQAPAEVIDLIPFEMEIGFWIFVGIVAGAMVQYFLGWVNVRLNYKKSLRNLKFELQFNISQIIEFQATATTMRNKINAEVLNQFFGYFPYSNLIWVTGTNMLSWGTLYDALNHEEIKKLVKISKVFSQAGENWPNERIVNLQKSQDKAAAVSFVDYLDKQFSDSKKDLEGIINKIDDEI